MKYSTARPRLKSASTAAAVLVFIWWVTYTLPLQADENLSQRPQDEQECSISGNPADPTHLFASCNAVGGLLVARSGDGGNSWSKEVINYKTIDADGDVGRPYTDPSTAWDSFGNLFFTFIDNSYSYLITLLSTDGGVSFRTIDNFFGSIDQPKIVAGRTPASDAPVAVWVLWNYARPGETEGEMVAHGAPVTGHDGFTHFRVHQRVPGTAHCNFGNIAIAPSGAVVQACQADHLASEGPSRILVNTDPDGLGIANFGQPVVVAQTNVGGRHTIPAEKSNKIDAAVGLAFDKSPGSPSFGRLYLVYTDDLTNQSKDMDITVWFSDDTGTTWHGPIRIDHDATSPHTRFLPRVSVDDTSGTVAVCWHDCRNCGDNNREVQIFCSTAVAASGGASPQFGPGILVSDGASTSYGFGYEFGDYAGLEYLGGVVHPVWADISNTTADNPDGTQRFDILSDRVTQEDMKRRVVPKKPKGPRPANRPRPKPP